MKKVKILFLYPKYPLTSLSFAGLLKIVDKKAMFPPLGLLTIASIVPEEWEKKLIDLNTHLLDIDDVKWADIIFISAMNVQKEDTIAVIKLCKKEGKIVVAGGPMFTHMQEEFVNLGVDHFVLGEGEVTLPLFLEDFSNGNPKYIYKSTKRADLLISPIPMWSLINSNDYYLMLFLYSRGCPFNCEFCDSAVTFGRTVRTKSPKQIINELQTIYDSGFKGPIMVADDNIIGNKKNANKMLLEVIKWQEERNFPFEFMSNVSVNLVEDETLLELMSKANFKSVFFGIESPSIESLNECGKVQNTKLNLVDSVRKAHKNGMMVMGGFIVGFDHDTKEIFDEQIEFIEKTGITNVMVRMLYAMRGTQLWSRLEKEGRLLNQMEIQNKDVTTNIIPKMGINTLIEGYNQIVSTIYEPNKYYKRINTLVDSFKPVRNRKAMKITKKKFRSKGSKFGQHLMEEIKIAYRALRFLGIKSKFRRRFWNMFFRTMFKNPGCIRLAVEQAICGKHFGEVIRNNSALLDNLSNYVN